MSRPILIGLLSKLLQSRKLRRLSQLLQIHQFNQLHQICQLRRKRHHRLLRLLNHLPTNAHRAAFRRHPAMAGGGSRPGNMHRCAT